MKDVRENRINANEEVTENIRTIMLKEADGFTAEAKKYYEAYQEITDEEEKKRKGDMFRTMYAKACAVYNCMKALGIISESEEQHIIIEAFEKATGVKVQL